MEPRLFHQAMN